MSNYNELNSIENPKKNYIKYISKSIAIIPMISSILCTVYIIMMYHDIKSLVTDFNSINSLVNDINITKMTTLVDGVLSLENCIFKKLSICS